MLGFTQSINGFFSSFAFERPWFLLLLLLLPVLWYFSFGSLAGLGRWRRLFALLFRTCVYSLLVFALAKAQWQKHTDQLCVIYVLDQSESIPIEKRGYMMTYAARSVEKHRRADDQAGMVIFGGNAKIESPPYDGPLPVVENRAESGFNLKTESTSLEAALKLAKASFPEGTARRVVIISDGNENLGDARSMARSMSEEGTGIDVIPVALIANSEISVEKVVLPVDIRKGQDFEGRVVINNDSDQPVTGSLEIFRRNMRENKMIVNPTPKTLQPGKNVFTFEHQIDQSAVYNIDAKFNLDDPSLDVVKKNNEASAFTHVRGKGRVLLIEDGNHTGEFDYLIGQLQKGNIEIDVMPSTELFTSPSELMQYDSVILANVPRATGEDVESTESFSDAQIKMMVRNCEELGCGIVMIGGDRSFGAGGWSNSELEKAMPVDFQIKNDKVSAVGALALMMHACEMPDGNYWQTIVAKEAIKVLGPLDYCGVIEWSDMGAAPRWLWKFSDPKDGKVKGVAPIFNNRKKMMGMVSRMVNGDMPDFNKPMQVMLKGLKSSNASMKHVIIISDGDPTPPSNALLKKFIDAKIKISTCTIGAHRQNNPMQNIAQKTGGKHYNITDPRALPKIYQREARRVAKPVIKESKEGMAAVPTGAASNNDITRGIKPENLPPFYGYVMTTIKNNPLVEQLLVASQPKDYPENSTLLASWRYGVGRTVAFTSDGGDQWLGNWYQDPQYGKFFTQMVRYSMRPITEDANFTISSDVKDNRARVVVTALDKDDEFLNFLNLSARGFDPSLEGFDINFTQVAPGRYVAEFDTDRSGNYLFSVFPGEGYQRLTAGVSVPYSSEYSDRETNLALLDSMSALEPRRGQKGELLEGYLGGEDSDQNKIPDGIDKLLETNTFRPTLTQAVSIQSMWPFLLLLCGTVFFFDVFVRRVAIQPDPIFAAVKTTWRKIFPSEVEETPSSMARLQTRKAEIEKKFEERRAATRFEPVVEADDTKSGKQQLEDMIASEHRKEIQAPPTSRPDPKLEEDKQSSYTSRLLDAKRRAQKDKDRGKE
jgi:uncharacterized membrane protein